VRSFTKQPLLGRGRSLLRSPTRRRQLVIIGCARPPH